MREGGEGVGGEWRVGRFSREGNAATLGWEEREERKRGEDRGREENDRRERREERETRETR